ncbi:unnamed protein product [Mycena citricolor]|uniref:Uncharacterized protein n=1 Tax=Mycena citricolor TaxID=2018698 RepID=A0AAD2HDC9_9AGAR|nr:unnamed protein product [Mycena citricolor]
MIGCCSLYLAILHPLFLPPTREAPTAAIPDDLIFAHSMRSSPQGVTLWLCVLLFVYFDGHWLLALTPTLQTAATSREGYIAKLSGRMSWHTPPLVICSMIWQRRVYESSCIIPCSTERQWLMCAGHIDGAGGTRRPSGDRDLGSALN